MTETDAQGKSSTSRCSFFEWMAQTSALRALAPDAAAVAALPFDFWGGLVGYLGYELKVECGGANVHTSPHADAALFFADQLCAVDHRTRTLYALALHDGSPTALQAAHSFLASHAAALCSLASTHAATPPPASAAGTVPQRCTTPCAVDLCAESAKGAASSSIPAAAAYAAPTGNGTSCALNDAAAAQDTTQLQCGEPAAGGAAREGRCGSAGGTSAAFTLARGRAQYLRDVESCQGALRSGDSYEICLTNTIHREGAPEAWPLYKVLRRVNKAPYAAWLHFGHDSQAPIACCSSPERFLRLDRCGTLEARPIKGTAARVPGDAAADAAVAAALAASEKDRAENLMIVDLLRNDLGRVCTPGSVHVPSLMQVESFASVHQLVSTVRGQVAAPRTAVDCLHAAFPGGSMTGAPKIRSMAIIDALERAPRALYSGSLGFLSVNGTCDFNIVIRTAVISAGISGERRGGEGRVTIGAGGAIVVQSNAEEEYEEMELKARRLLQAVATHEGAATAPPLLNSHDFCPIP